MDTPAKMEDTAAKTDKMEKLEIEDIKPVEKEPVVEKPTIMGCHTWVLKVVFASICMGVGQFIYATNFSYIGTQGTGFLGSIPLAILVLFKLILAIKNKVKKGVFIDKENSNIIDTEGKIKWKNIVPILGNWYANSAQVFLFTYAYKFAKLAGLNQGIVPILTLFASFFNSAIFYFVFGEKISLPKALGMVFAISCALLLMIESTSKKGETFVDESGVEQSKEIYAFYCLGLAMLVPVGYSLKHFLVRRFQKSYNYYYLPIDSSIFENLTLVVFFGIYLQDNEVSTGDFFLGGLAGSLMVIGRIFIAVGIAEGVAGPAQAIMSTNGIWMTLLALIFDGQALSLL